MQGGEPRRAIRVAERNALADLLDVFFGMEVVSVGELPAELLREQHANGGFPGADYSHEGEDQASVPHLGTVFHPCIVARIDYQECAVRICKRPNFAAGVFVIFWVGNEFSVNVVRRSAIHSIMELPQTIRTD